MHEKFTLEIHRADGWYIGSCPEVPGANGQGRTLMACSKNLVQAISLLLDDEDVEPTTQYVEVQLVGQKQNFQINLVESLEGFSVSCPELPGCWSQGDDKEEALENIQSAVKDYVEAAEDIRQQQLLK